MASGWESEGPGFKPRQLRRQPLTPGCQKEEVIPSQKQCAFHENNLQGAL